MEWSTIPACPSLMCSFNRGNIEGTNSLKIDVWCLCMYVLCLWNDWLCRLTWQRVDMYVRRVWKRVFAYDLSLTVQRWPCVADRTLKSDYYYDYYYLHCRGLSPDPEQHPQSEDYWGHVNPIGPRACYDEGKRVAETMCYAYKKQVCVMHSICQLLILARYLAREIYKLRLNSWNTKYSQNVTCVCKNIC